MSSFQALSAVVNEITEISSRNDTISSEKLQFICNQITVAAQSSSEDQESLGTNLVTDFLWGHSTNEEKDVVESILRSLLHISRRETLVKSTMNAANCALIVQKATCLLNIVDRFYLDSTIAQLVCTLVMVLASDSSERQKELGKIGIATRIVNILNYHRGLELVVEFAYRAVRNLSVFTENCRPLVDAGIINCLKNSIDDFNQNLLSKDTYDAILYAIINLSDDEEIIVKIGEAGIVLEIVNMYSQLLDRPEILGSTALALRNLLSAAENLVAVRSTKVDEYLHQIILVHCRDDPNTLQDAVWCMANMAADIEFRKRFIYDLHMIQAFREIFYFGLEHFPADEELGPFAEAVTFVIQSLAYDRDSSSIPKELGEHVDLVRILVADGALELLSIFLHRYVTREAMMESCYRALIVLFQGNLQAQLTTTAEYCQNIVSAILAGISEHIQEAQTVYLGMIALSAVIAANHNYPVSTDIDALEHTIYRMNLKAEAANHLHILTKVLSQHRDYSDIADLVINVLLLFYSPEIRLEKLNRLQALGVWDVTTKQFGNISEHLNEIVKEFELNESILEQFTKAKETQEEEEVETEENGEELDEETKNELIQKALQQLMQNSENT
jgi:hypothetical protein